MRTIQLPGMHSPAAGFDEPFVLLAACHERMERSLHLLQKLVAHVCAHGVDTDAQQAAADVLRYFDLAAPLHHEDEELHIFPVLLAQTEAPALHPRVQQLQREHVQMTQLWQRIRRPLTLVAEGQTQASVWSAQELAEVHAFVALYLQHVREEDLYIYPPAAQHVSAAQWPAIGADMAQRRGAGTEPKPAAQNGTVA